MFTFSCTKGNNDDINPKRITDIDGNIYHTVTIGKQLWMLENLKTTRLNDGTPIPNITNGTAWGALTIPGFCTNQNRTNADTINLYGRLYNWYAVNTGKLCPIGWHVPTNAEWDALINFVGGTRPSGIKLKEIGTTHWSKPNASVNDSSGFTGLPAGYRNENGEFEDYGDDGFWWSSNERLSYDAWGENLCYYVTDILKVNYKKNNGFSIRCLKD